MTNGSVRFEWRGAAMTLLPDRALWLPTERAAVVADVHLGKTAAFGAWGVPAPAGVTERDLGRLEALARDTDAQRLVVLGDFVHAREGLTREVLGAVADWRARLSGVAVTVVRGNHDRRAGALPDRLAVETTADPLPLGPLSTAHDPADAPPGAPTLCGHLHPAVRIAPRRGGQSLRAPCFWFGADVAVLPAFGSFTGTRRVDPAPGDRVFAVGPGGVVDVS